MTLILSEPVRPDGCHNCAHWFDLPALPQGEVLFGECRKRCPGVVNAKGFGIFPRTFENDVCGEWGHMGAWQ